jgi:hypothetical protein
MQFFAGLEADRFAWSNCDFCAGSWIAANAGFPRFDGEDAKATEFNAIASDESLFHAIEDSVNGGLRFRPWQACSLNHPLYQILLNHLGRRPWAVICLKRGTSDLVLVR